MPIAFIGLIFSYLRRGKALILPSFLLGFIVMFPMGYAHRFWRFNSYMPYAALGGLALSAAIERLVRRFHWKQNGIIVATAILLVAIAIDPVFLPAHAPRPPGPRPPMQKEKGMPGRVFFAFEGTALTRMLGRPNPAMGNLLLEPDVRKALDMIEEHSRPEDIVAYGMGPMSCLVTAMTNRRTNGGMLGEVHSENMHPGYEKVNIVVIPDKPSGKPPIPNRPPPPPFARQMFSRETSPPKGFELIVESEGIRLFRNPDAP